MHPSASVPPALIHSQIELPNTHKWMCKLQARAFPRDTGVRRSTLSEHRSDHEPTRGCILRLHVPGEGRGKALGGQAGSGGVAAQRRGVLLKGLQISMGLAQKPQRGLQAWLGLLPRAERDVLPCRSVQVLSSCMRWPLQDAAHTYTMPCGSQTCSSRRLADRAWSDTNERSPSSGAPWCAHDKTGRCSACATREKRSSVKIA